MESITTNWTREELKAYILLYCAHADFIETKEEVDYIKSKVSNVDYKKIHNEFEKDSDYESIQKIEYTIEKYNYTKKEIDSLFKRIKELFYIDDEFTAAEQSIFIGLKHLLREN
ncbi:hypothetical protein [Marixanthomonas ophiurae]|uniref:TerB family tellurite resistance protein n=1 Tax=Marixanthomonas ophiurae TaxID=387659 RepID=A0A3E1QDP0_9FLAO|nr:hypothetical protein [Marixanthomonas ophiurae]RFN60176.1 hypothetical protein DZ858_09080 [Marixanthomonas ophiurae]